MLSFRFSPRPNRARQIHWHQWYEEAFQKAQSQDKPILLSISAVWCHQCHVMDETCYSDDEVIRLINKSFVPVRVDADQRPDIDQRYSMGDGPTTALLTPHGDTITGATCIPVRNLRELLVKVIDQYRSHKADLYQRAAEARRRQEEHTRKAIAGVQVDSSILDSAVIALMAQFDPDYGGFGSEQKFPRSQALELLIHVYQRTGDDQYNTIVEKTLDSMQTGGVFDQEMGGFFRYSTTRDWSVPQIEKRLEDNANLLRVYLHAYMTTLRDAYRHTAEKTIGYLSSYLYSPNLEAFRGSQYADEDCYARRPEEGRQQRAPSVDATVYTHANALAASVYLEAAVLLGKSELRQIALKALDLSWSRCHVEGGSLYHCYMDGGPAVDGFLADYAYLANALLDAYKHTGEGRYLEQAQSLAEGMATRFWDPQGGAFFDIQGDPLALGYLKLREKPLAPNAVASEVLNRLYLATYQQEYKEKASSTLSAMSQVYQSAPGGEPAQRYAKIVDCLLNPPVEVTIVGSPGADDTLALMQAAANLRYPHKDLTVVDTRDGDLLEARGYEADARAQAYVCLDTVCLPPIQDPGELTSAVSSFLSMKEQMASYYQTS